MLIWSDEKIEALKTLWDDDAMTMREIGLRLGITKNAVAGKVFRLGLQARKAPKLTKDIRILRRRARFKRWYEKQKMLKQQAKQAIPVAKEAPAPVGVTILEREHDQCAYPIENRLFCGAKVFVGVDSWGNAKETSWCEYHWLLCHKIDQRKARIHGK